MPAHTMAIIVIPSSASLDGYLALACTAYVLRRGYQLLAILRDAAAATRRLAAGDAQVVVYATRTQCTELVGRAEFVDEEETRILYRRNTAIGRYRVPPALTEAAVRRIIYDGAPGPMGVDPESIAAARRLARHFAAHGCA